MEDLIRTGIDFPNYPQLIDMGKQFLDDLVRQDCGIVKENGGYTLKKEEIGEPSSPPGLDPYKWTLAYLESEGILDKVKLKACITGPFTLASYVRTRRGAFPLNTAVSDIERVRELADTISGTCRTIAENAYMISVDEPILSVTVGTKFLFNYGERDIVEIYNSHKRFCGNRPLGTHICGRISALLAKTLLRTELDFVSHEFHDTPENFNVYDRNALEETGKVLSVGCVSSRNSNVETVEEILNIMEKSTQYGDDLIFTPDCGFRNLKVDGSSERGYRIAVLKLRNMAEAVNRFSGR